MDCTDKDKLTVVLLLADKKLRQLAELVESTCEQSDEVRYVQVNGNDSQHMADFESVLAQGNPNRCVVVLHKAAYDLLARHRDVAAAARWEMLQRMPPSMPLDPVDRTLCFADRASICCALKHLAPLVQQPRYAELRGSLDDVMGAITELNFPLLCKPFDACGSDGHHLRLVLREEGLSELFLDGDRSSSTLKRPLIAQEFVDHGGLVIKGYTIGDFSHLTIKRSLPDLSTLYATDEGPAIMDLDSQSLLAGAFKGASDVVTNEDTHAATLLSRTRHEAEEVLNAIRLHMGVQLLGIDMILGTNGQLLVVDANHFSSTPHSVPGFRSALTALLRSRNREVAHAGAN